MNECYNMNSDMGKEVDMDCRIYYSSLAPVPRLCCLQVNGRTWPEIRLPLVHKNQILKFGEKIIERSPNTGPTDPFTDNPHSVVAS